MAQAVEVPSARTSQIDCPIDSNPLKFCPMKELLYAIAFGLVAGMLLAGQVTSFQQPEIEKSVIQTVFLVGGAIGGFFSKIALDYLCVRFYGTIEPSFRWKCRVILLILLLVIAILLPARQTARE
jgi:hypothetical protein